MALANPTPPRNIDALIPGQVVRIQLIGSYVLNGDKIQEIQVARPNRRPGFVGFVLVNDVRNRVLTVNVADLTFPQLLVRAEVPYRRIRVIELQVEGGYVSTLKNPLRIPAYVPVYLRWRP